VVIILKFSKYLDESTLPDKEEIINIIDNKVDKQFLSDIKKAGSFVYRGLLDNITDFKIKETHEIRNSNMNVLLKDALNVHFNKKFGWNVRDGIFTTSNWHHIIKFFGKKYIFFPIGDYKFVWSKKIGDINLEDRMMKFNGAVRFRTDDLDGVIKEFDEWLINDNILQSYVDDDLPSAIESQNEISFKCKEYMAINFEYNNVLKEKYL